MIARDISLARAVMGVAKTFNTAFMGLAGTCHQQAAEEAGVPFIAGRFVLAASSSTTIDIVIQSGSLTWSTAPRASS